MGGSTSRPGYDPQHRGEAGRQPASYRGVRWRRATALGRGVRGRRAPAHTRRRQGQRTHGRPRVRLSRWRAVAHSPTGRARLPCARHRRGIRGAQMTERKGRWIKTYPSGRKFWPLDPRPEDILIEDIAHSLAHTCRFNGHCRFLYTVAQHSVYVSHIVPPRLAFMGLMHDASEAYVGDMVRPLKLDMPAFRAAEGLVWQAIAQRYDLPIILPSLVDDADDAMLLTESACLQVQDEDKPKPRRPGVAPADITIAFWTCEQARTAFLNRFRVLTAAA